MIGQAFLFENWRGRIEACEAVILSDSVEAELYRRMTASINSKRKTRISGAEALEALEAPEAPGCMLNCRIQIFEVLSIRV
jgi:hypothetical protein